MVNRDLQKLIDVSIERSGGRKVFCSVTPIKVCMECRKIYTRQSSILVDAKRECSIDAAASTSVFNPPGTRRRSGTPLFNFI